MAYKQETCPLCGRNLTAIETYPGRGEVYCCHCDLTIGGNDAKTPEELIALLDGSEHRRLKAENANLREENKRLRAMAVSYYTEQLLHSDDVLGQIMAKKKLKELGEAENV